MRNELLQLRKALADKKDLPKEKIGVFFMKVYKDNLEDASAFIEEINAAWGELKSNDPDVVAIDGLQRTWDQYKSNCKRAIELDLYDWCNNNEYELDTIWHLNKRLQEIRNEPDQRENVLDLLAELTTNISYLKEDEQRFRKAKRELRNLINKLDSI